MGSGAEGGDDSDGVGSDTGSDDSMPPLLDDEMLEAEEAEEEEEYDVMWYRVCDVVQSDHCEDAEWGDLTAQDQAAYTRAADFSHINQFYM